MLSAVSPARPRLVVCEDGAEYVDRFRRFLGDAFEFVSAGDYSAARAACAGAQGLLLDLDFRRTAADRLVDEHGRAAVPVDEGTRRRLAESQGIFILRALRAQGVALAAILFADLEDVEQARFLERTLAPLTIARSSAGLRELAALMSGLPHAADR
jgi:hypothetical protein